MVEAVVLGVEGDEVPGVGAAVVLVVDDVVHFDVAGAVAPWDAAAEVAVLHEAAGAIGHDPLAPPNGDGDAVVGDDGADRAVAEEEVAEPVGDAPTVGEGHRHPLERIATVGVAGGEGFEVDVDAVALPAVAGDVAHGAGDDVDECVGVGHSAAFVGGGSAEEAVFGFADGGIQQAAVVGVEFAVEAVAAVRSPCREQMFENLLGSDSFTAFVEHGEVVLPRADEAELIANDLIRGVGAELDG